MKYVDPTKSHRSLFVGVGRYAFVLLLVPPHVNELVKSLVGKTKKIILKNG